MMATDYKGLGTWGYRWRMYSKLRAANRAWSPKQDMARQPFPAVIQLQTINACNAACTMCPYPLFKGKFTKGRMDDALFDKVADEIAHHPEVDTFVPMLQNEPFLDKRILDRVKAFKERTGGRVAVELVTNGAFLTEDTVEHIRTSGLDVLDISLDALSREVYEKIRIGLDYDEVLAGVNRVIDAQLPHTAVFVRLVRVRENFRQVKAFARAWKKKGVPVFIYSANSRAGALPNFDQELRVPEAQVPWSQRVGRRVLRGLLHHCPVPFAAAAIVNNGDVLLCTQDWARHEVLGNVREQTLAAIWNGPRMREIRSLIAERRYSEVPSCADCSLWRDGWF
jgi:radical SAM protein with 4Fe4S-binding SPASM domain